MQRVISSSRHKNTIGWRSGSERVLRHTDIGPSTKRGNRPAATAAARVERGHERKQATAGRVAHNLIHGGKLGKPMQYMNTRLQQQDAMVTLLKADRQQLLPHMQSCSQPQASTLAPSAVDTRVLGKPELHF